MPRCGKLVLHCAVLLYITSWNTWRNLDTNGGTIRWTDGLILMVTSLRSDLYGMLGHLACTKSRQIHIIFSVNKGGAEQLDASFPYCCPISDQNFQSCAVL